jgi:hypothetical protein
MRKDKKPYRASGNHMVQEVRLEVGFSSRVRQGFGGVGCDEPVGELHWDGLPADDHIPQRSEIKLLDRCFNFSVEIPAVGESILECADVRTILGDGFEDAGWRMMRKISMEFKAEYV